jgi:hypothetical protein
MTSIFTPVESREKSKDNAKEPGRGHDNGRVTASGL